MHEPVFFPENVNVHDADRMRYYVLAVFLKRFVPRTFSALNVDKMALGIDTYIRPAPPSRYRIRI